MKKNKKALLIIIGVAVLLVGGLLALIFLGGDKKPTDIDKGTDISIATNDQGIYEAVVATDAEGNVPNNSYGVLLSKSPFDLKEIDVENEFGTYQIKAETKKVKTTDPDTGEESEATEKTIYTLVGYEDFDLAQGMPDAVGNACTNLEFSKVSSVKGDNLADFGLDKPRSTAHVKYDDGTKAIIKVGKEAPSSAGVYIQFGTHKTVYLASEESIEALLYDVTKLFDLNINNAAETEEKAEPSFIKISGNGFKEALELRKNKDEANPAYYILASHNNLFASTVESSEIASGIRGLYAEEVVSVNPSEAQLKELKLDKPHAILSAEYPDIKVNLKASAPDDENNVLLYNMDKKLVYKVRGAAVPWVSTSYSKLISEYILYPESNAVKAIEVSYKSKTYKFDIKTTTKNVTDDNGEESEVKDTKVTYNNKVIDLEKFETFTKNVVLLEHSKVTTKSAKGSPEITIKYTYNTGRNADTVKFYSEDAKTYLATVNNITIGTVTKAKANKAFDSVLEAVK